MTPNEIARLGDNALIFIEGKNAILGKTYNPKFRRILYLGIA
jgi:hypothetical protein